jgi:hypothetical protein
MDKDFKEKWIEALRGDEYAQGRCALNEDNNFCCLGVLADIYINEIGGEWKISSFSGLKTPIFIINGEKVESFHVGNLSEELRVELDLSQKQISTLIELNDYKKCSFEEIADYIEKNL